MAHHVVAAPEPLSRADVATLTGMTRSTASRLVDDLVAAGILTELSPTHSAGPGRPAVPLVPASGTFMALGLEINVTHMAVRAIDLAGTLIAERIIIDDFTNSDPERVLGRLGSLISDILSLPPLQQARMVGAGLALPGLVSGDHLLRAPNLGWSTLRPADYLEPVLSRHGLSLTVGNEASLAALTVGRDTPGSPAQWPSFLFLSGENGIGAGIVRDGVAEPGANGFAGEIGHIQIDPNGPECSCGNRGCVERYAGRQALLAAARMPATTTSEELIEALAGDSSPAHEALEQAITALSVGLAAAVNLLDIPVIVLGGYLAPLTDLIRPHLAEQLSRRVLASQWQSLEILQADDDEMPGATGAAWSLLEQVVENPAAWVE